MRMNMKYSAAAIIAASSLSLTYACGDSGGSGDEGSSTESSGDGAGGNGTAGGNTGGDGGTFLNTGGGQGGDGGHCQDLLVEADQVLLPSDIIFVIDNSGSMGEETASVEQNINTNFAQIIGASALDYQVIMVTRHGTSNTQVCIGPPLSNSTNCSQPPGEVPGQFYHYNAQIESHDALCSALDTLYGSAAGGRADLDGNHVNGWYAVLRQEAVKVFVAITDDGIDCHCPSTGSYGCTSPALDLFDIDDNDNDPDGKTVAEDWDQKLMALAPAQFGTLADRNYVFYSIVGMQENTNPQDPYQWYDPIVESTCGTACVAPGTGYQWLSMGTQVLRFPVSQYASYDSVFQDMAAGVVEGAQVPCDINITDPQGQELDWNTVKVVYTPGDGAGDEKFDNVGSEGACGLTESGFWVDEVNLVVHLCPNTCGVVTDDNDAELNVVIDCGGIAN